MNRWNFGESDDGIPLAWYTPEGYAQVTALQEEYVESGQCARDDAVLAIYAANPASVLVRALMNEGNAQ